MKTLIAEYNPATFYMGWHLYLRDRTDGSRNDDGEWGWIRRSSLLCVPLADFVRSINPAAPEVKHVLNTQDEISQWNRFTEWFAVEFPHGIEIAENLLNPNKTP